MKHTIMIQNNVPNEWAPTPEHLESWANQCLDFNKQQGKEVSICIVEATEIAQLNEQYRNKAKPTNVLSFGYQADESLPHDDHDYLGDIIICAAIVNQEAIDQNKAANDHWAHMVVHGIFHLLGYDHETNEEALEMEGLETKALEHMGFTNPYQTGGHIESHE